MKPENLRVLVVDHNAACRSIVSGALAEVPGVQVVGVAANGRIALQKAERLRPDLLTLDLEMPEMDALEVLRRLPSCSSGAGAIVLCTAANERAQAALQALELGVFDCLVKPGDGRSPAASQRFREELRLRVEAFTRNRQIRSILQGEGDGTAGSTVSTTPSTGAEAFAPQNPDHCESGVELVAIGVSTGGPQALAQMLPELPEDLPAAVLVVQHVPAAFTPLLAGDLDRRCRLRVAEASDGETVSMGKILIAPGGRQMRVERIDGVPHIRLTDDPPENSCRPSVDYLFRSVAEGFGPRALGVIMTGMGNDGAEGCRRLHQRGAAILAQDQASCVVFGMPREPVERGIATAVPLYALAEEIVRRVGKGAPACK